MDPRHKLYRQAYFLSIFTIGYNILEGLISVFFGISDETLALAGFGIDSFIEAISGFGILQMVTRIGRNPGSPVSRFEVTALRITGYGFYLLALGLVAGILVNVIQGHKPESTFWGTVISSVSIVVMIWLVISKKRIGKTLGSDPILADANCTLVCIYMSVVLLISSAVYELTGFAYADAIGAAGLVWFSFSEGRESLAKAKKRSYSECSCHPGQD
jgi:divalent metal cation (Fe/Co/Zn/Cd) transporter